MEYKRQELVASLKRTHAGGSPETRSAQQIVNGQAFLIAARSQNRE
jgi:hypothetical protein